MIKAKKFQPLAVLNQKLKGLDVFESNDTPPAPSPNVQPSSSIAQTPSKRPESPRPDPDDVVTKAHWQRPGGNDICSDPTCGKRLNSTNGRVNCRKCGKLFCDDHTMYQMKLSRSAQHEPVRGFWCRVCETCYKSREGYNDHNGRLAVLYVLRFEMAESYRSCNRSYQRLRCSQAQGCRPNLPRSLETRKTPH